MPKVSDLRMNPHSMWRRRLVVYWCCQAAGWGGYFVVSIVASQSFTKLSFRIVVFYLFLGIGGILLTHGFRAYLRWNGWIELPLQRLLPRVLAANLLMSLILVGAGFLYSRFLPLKLNMGPHRDPISLLATVFLFVFNDFIILTIWAGIYFGVAYFERQQRAKMERYQSRTALVEAELKGLRSQLNPHFLFNALNSLRGLVVEDPSRSQSAITQLAGILRYHLTSGERSLVPLGEELATVEQYLSLELVRFEDRLSIVTEAETRAKSCLVPPLAVQTLVENAIKYGVSHDAAPGRIAVSAGINADRLVIVVGNTGTLRLDAAQDSTGLGLTNLRTRLRLLFAEQASLELHEPSPGWVEARLVLPMMQSFGTT